MIALRLRSRANPTSKRDTKQKPPHKPVKDAIVVLISDIRPKRGWISRQTDRQADRLQGEAATAKIISDNRANCLHF